MPFNEPQYPLLASLWRCDGSINPNAGPPDYTSIPCEKYINPRTNLDCTPPFEAGFWHFWCPPVVLRFPMGDPFFPTWPQWKISYTEVPEGSGQFYRTFFRDIMHEGFPNQYAMLIAVQCDGDGKAIPPPGASFTTGDGSNICGD